MAISNTILIGIKAVKDSKKAKDMFDTEEVQKIAFEMGFYETSNWIKTNKSGYFLFYLQTDWDKIISIYPEKQT